MLQGNTGQKYEYINWL